MPFIIEMKHTIDGSSRDSKLNRELVDNISYTVLYWWSRIYGSIYVMLYLITTTIKDVAVTPKKNHA